MDNFVAYITEHKHDLVLDRAALLLARAFQADLDVDYYLHRLDTMAEEIYGRLLPNSGPDQVHDEILEYLYLDCGYGGNSLNYYDIRNLFLNEVIELRVGMPITLCVLHMELARRLSLGLWGVGLPGHFIIGGEYRGGVAHWDPFFAGARMSEEDCARRVHKLSSGQIEFDPTFLQPTSPQRMLQRMLRNLKMNFIHRNQAENALLVVEMLLPLSTDPSPEIRDRGILWLRMGDVERARTDLEHYLEMNPDADDAEAVRLRLQRLGGRRLDL